MPRLALVSPMHEELRAVLAHMPDESRVPRANRDFYVGHFDGHEVVAVLSRIGKVATATTATLLITAFDVDRILFTGTAGGLGDGVNVGDVVVADTLLQHDMDASPLFPRHEVPLYGKARFAADRAMSDDVAEAAAFVLHAMAHSPELAPFGITTPRLHRGLMVSGDRFVSTKAENDELRASVPDALSVEMEGAALAQVCHDFGVRYAVVRTISDRADDSAHVDFNRFVTEVASRYSLDIVRRYLAMRPAR
jgi:adenosylhomocysteine nucleosidase